jgi:hypothetical protein
VAGALLAVGLAACGGDGGSAGPSSAEPGGVVARYYAGKREPKVLCSTLSERFLATYGSRARCATVIRPAPAGVPTRVDIEQTHVTDDHAEVVFQVIGAGKARATLVREHGGWRIDGLTHVEAKDEREREREAGGKAKPESREQRARQGVRHRGMNGVARRR